MFRQFRLSSLPVAMIAALLLTLVGFKPAAADSNSGFKAKKGADGRQVIKANCHANPDALLKRFHGKRAGPDTTYRIKGACNGPLYVIDDGVYFIGVDEDAAIVLPGPPADPSNGAVFGDGAHDLRIENLLLDASAWGTGEIADGTDAAGLYARNAFVRVIDSRIVGGQWSINPFRNAIVRTEGLVELIDFVNSGISVGDQSLLTARGHVHLASSVTDGGYLSAVELYRGGTADFRRGLTIELPHEDESIGFYPEAISVYRHSHLRVRNGGEVDIDGNVRVDNLAFGAIDAGRIAGDVNVSAGSNLGLRNLTVDDGDIILDTGAIVKLGDVLQTEGRIEVGQNAVLKADHSDLGLVAGYLAATVQIEAGSVAGVELRLGSMADISGASVTADIGLFQPSGVNVFQEESGTLNGNTIYLCGDETSYIDPLLISPPDGDGGPGFVSDECLP